MKGKLIFKGRYINIMNMMRQLKMMTLFAKKRKKKIISKKNKKNKKKRIVSNFLKERGRKA